MFLHSRLVKAYVRLRTLIEMRTYASSKLCNNGYVRSKKNCVESAYLTVKTAYDLHKSLYAYDFQNVYMRKCVPENTYAYLTQKNTQAYLTQKNAYDACIVCIYKSTSSPLKSSFILVISVLKISPADTTSKIPSKVSISV